MQTLGHLIGGRRTAPAGRRAEVFNPATGEVSAEVCLADAGTVDEAVAAAREAFPGWRDTPPARRARVLMAVRQRLESHADEICRLITAEHGKTLADSLGELERGLENLEYAAAAPELLKGEFSRNVSAGVDAWSEYQPLGVVAGVTPFNFPAMVPLWMWPMALACGNCFVLKPSERDPSSALRVAELALEAGVPPGVLNVVNGDRVAVDALLAHPAVPALSFVGSTAVAESVYAAGTARGKRVQALGSAKNHAVVLPDADLDAVVPLLMGAAFGSCGERCMAIPMVVAVGDEVGDALVAGLKAAIGRMRVGPGQLPGVDMGPLVSRAHLERVRGYVTRAVAEGAELVVDGRGLEVPGHSGGFFLGPCLFDQVRTGMEIARDEVFGPVLAVSRVRSLDEAIAQVEAGEFANGTCLFTRDGGLARDFADRIQVGMVGINVPLPVPVAFHSFGGWKRSLFGDLHIYGPDAVRFYSRRKAVTQRWLGPGPGSAAGERPSFAFPSSR